MRLLKFKAFVIFLCFFTQLQSQTRDIKMHSHNDYSKPIPFWTAYNAGAASIEIDVIAHENQIFVAHDFKDIKKEMNIENLYVLPFLDAIALYPRKEKVAFLIDFKTDFDSTFKVLDSILKKYPDFKNKATLVISGKRPKTSNFDTYPDYILFDYQEFSEKITPEELKKVGMFSYNFKKISSWKGKGELDKTSETNLKEYIKLAHDNSQPIRFWATPDTEKAWEVLSKLGVDYINTDHTRALAAYLKK